MRTNSTPVNHMSIDLHGYSVKEAKQYIRVSLEEAHQRNTESMTVVTGIGNHRNRNGTRGVLFNAFPKWLKKMPELSSVVSDFKQDMGGYTLQFKNKPSLKEHCDKISQEMQELVDKTHSQDFIKKMEKDAKSGDIISLATIGSMKIHGIYLEKDIEAGIEYLEKAALKEASVMVQLGALYSSMEFAKQDYAKARYWYQEADKHNHPEGAFALGRMYWLGEGTIKNDKLALQFLKKAADNKHYHAAANVAEILFHGIGDISKDITSAMTYYNIAAEGGVVTAQRVMGMTTLTGKVVSKDVNIAFKWFELAAKQQDPESCYFLGVCYETGQGTKEDLIKAYVWYRKSANLGDLDAKFKIACAQLYGIVFPKDVNAALPILKKLATQNHVDSLYLLGLYLLENSSNSIQKEALSYLFRAGLAGNSEAIEQLIQLYLGGEYNENAEQLTQWITASVENTTSPNLYQRLISINAQSNIQNEHGKIWYKTLENRANKGEIDAIAHLGQILLIGCHIVKKDEKLAFSTLKKLENSAHHTSLTSLGYCYLNGLGTKINQTKARACFLAAGKLGNEIARRNYLSFLNEGDKLADEDLYLLECAAENNEVDIQVLASKLYLSHPGGDFFLSGIYWLYRAAQLHNDNALHFFRTSINAGHKKAIHEMLSQVYQHRHGTKSYPKIAELNTDVSHTSSYSNMIEKLALTAPQPKSEAITLSQAANDIKKINEPLSNNPSDSIGETMQNDTKNDLRSRLNF